MRNSRRIRVSTFHEVMLDEPTVCYHLFHAWNCFDVCQYLKHYEYKNNVKKKTMENGEINDGMNDRMNNRHHGEKTM